MSMYTANPAVDLVGTFNGQRFAIKHVFENVLLPMHNLVLLVEVAGQWERRVVILQDIQEADVKRVGAKAFIRAALAAINQALKSVYGDPGANADPGDIWAALDAAIPNGFAYRVTATGVEMFEK